MFCRNGADPFAYSRAGGWKQPFGQQNGHRIPMETPKHVAHTVTMSCEGLPIQHIGDHVSVFAALLFLITDLPF